MRILHVITSLYTGGAEKLMVDLLPRLKSHGHQVDLLLFNGTDTPFRQAAEAAGIRVFDLGKGGSVYSPARLLKLIPYLRKYDIIHTHNTAPQLFAAIGSIFKSATLYTTEHNTSNRRRKWKWYAAVDRWMYSRYRKVICISEKAEDNLREFIGESRAEILTINNGVDVERYASAIPSAELESIAPGSRKIIMVAGFRWEKDQDTIIKALTHMPENFHLFLVGDGVRRKECEALAAHTGVAERVHFLGIRSDVPALLHAADYVVMSSHFEGLSLSSVEGMSVGKPFLASDVDGLREVVNGAGILFPHGNAEALAAEILKLDSSTELYKAVADACRQRSLQFDISKMTDGYCKIYDSL
ncbi:glycosyltransferase [Muribaculum intestinale]|uniref:glycosyltransferase n=1 Tax=Muribaculum intestinale TaxID=1796646 RepID=UPI0025AA2AF5|nr:glycosyltransferase [Muribaculum intestinale]